MNKQILKEIIKITFIFCAIFIMFSAMIYVSTFKSRGINNLFTSGLSKTNLNIVDINGLEATNNQYKTLGKNSWILIKNKSNNRLIFKIDFQTQENIDCVIYYGNSREDFNEENKINIVLKPGENLIDINQKEEDQFFRVDIHTDENFEFKIDSIVSEPIIYSYIRNDILNNGEFYFIIAIITMLVELFIKSKDTEFKVDMAYWIVLIVSIIFIFSRFIVGESFYMYKDCGQDTINQYYPYFVNEALNLKDGTFSSWNFDYGLGTCLLNTNAWAFDIFSIILVLLGIIFGIGKIHYFLVYMQILKIIVIYALTKKYLSYFIKEKNNICLASYISSLSGYVILWGQHYFLGTACFYIILMLIAIENLLHKKSKNRFLLLSLTVASLLIFSFYIGYMILLAIALYYVYRYIRINETISFKQLISDFSKCLFSVFTGFLLSGIIFLPSCYNVLTTSSRLSNASSNIFERSFMAFKDSFSLSNINEILSRMISNNMFLDANTSKYYENIQVFCTIFIVFFIIQFFIYEIKTANTKKDYIMFVIKIVSIYFMIFNSLSGLIFNAFAYPAFRYSFIMFPFFGIIIGVVFEEVISKRKINIIGLIISFALSIYIWYHSYNVLLTYKIKYSYLLLVELIAGFGILFLMKFNSKNINVYKFVFTFLIIFSTALDHYVSTNFRLIFEASDYSLLWNKSELIGDTAEAIKWIKENDKSFYRVEKTYDIFSTTGDSFIEKVSTLTCYNSTLNPNIVQFYEEIYPHSLTVMYAIKKFDLQDASDLQALYLTNSKYILSKAVINMDGIEEIQKIGNVHIYRNVHTDSVAKFFTKTITSDEYLNQDDSVKEKILYTEAIVDDSNLNLDENATAQIGEFYLKSQTDLCGNIKSDGKGLVMISTPYQEGWNVYIDGELAKEKYKVDYGFIRNCYS